MLGDQENQVTEEEKHDDGWSKLKGRLGDIGKLKEDEKREGKNPKYPPGSDVESDEPEYNTKVTKDDDPEFDPHKERDLE